MKLIMMKVYKEHHLMEDHMNIHIFQVFVKLVTIREMRKDRLLQLREVAFQRDLKIIR